MRQFKSLLKELSESRSNLFDVVGTITRGESKLMSGEVSVLSFWFLERQKEARVRKMH